MHSNLTSFKMIVKTAISGMLLAAVLVIIISEIDQYYDWLLVKQSILLGLIAGIAAGFGITYYQKIRRRAHQDFLNQPIVNIPTPAPTLNKADQDKPKEIKPITKNGIGFWGFFGRLSLGGFLGFVIGMIGGIWYCADSYGGLSSEAQAWIIFYVPFYAITVVVCAILGCGTGAGFGLLMGLLKSGRN